MPLFICEICDVVENTARGHFHARGLNLYKDQELAKKALCAEHAPTEYTDGTDNKSAREERLKKFESREKVYATEEYLLNHETQHLHFKEIGRFQYLRDQGRIKNWLNQPLPNGVDRSYQHTQTYGSRKDKWHNREIIHVGGKHITPSGHVIAPKEEMPLTAQERDYLSKLHGAHKKRYVKELEKRYGRR